MAPPSEHHRSGGEWRVEHPRVRWEILDAFRDARRSGRHRQGRRLQRRRQRRLVLLPGQPAARAGAGAPPAPSSSRCCRGRTCGFETGVEVERVADRGRPRHRRRVHRAGGAPDRARVAGEVILAAGAIGSPKHPAAVRASATASGCSEAGIAVRAPPAGRGRATCRTTCRSGRSTRSRGVRTLNTDYANLFGAPGMGAGIRAAPQRAPDHGAVAARHVRALLARVRDRRTCSSTSSRCRSTSWARGCTRSAPSPPASATCARPAAAASRLRSADPAAPPQHRARTTSPPRRTAGWPWRRCAWRAASWPSRRWRPTGRRSSGPGRESQSDADLAARRPARSAPPSSTPSAPPPWAPTASPGRARRPAAGARRRGPAGRSTPRSCRGSPPATPTRRR